MFCCSSKIFKYLAYCSNQLYFHACLLPMRYKVFYRVTECYRVLQSVAECCRVLQSVAECCKALHSVEPFCIIYHTLAEGSTVWQNGTECCRVFNSVSKCCTCLLFYLVSTISELSSFPWSKTIEQNISTCIPCEYFTLIEHFISLA